MKNFTKPLFLLALLLNFALAYSQKDTIPPVIELNTNDTICVKLGEVYLAVMPTVTDNVSSSNMISLRLINNPVNSLIPGIYKEVYEAVDAAGNTSTKTRYVKVDENCPSATRTYEYMFETITMYPNPANAYFELYIPYLKEIAHLKIYSMNGSLIVNQDLYNSFNHINVENFNDGIYWIQVAQNNNTFSQKLLIRR